MLSTEKESKKRGFLVNRLIRLAPLYWLLTIATFVVAQFIPELLGYTPTIEHFLKSMFFVPFSRISLKNAEVIRPIVGLGHTLQIEIFFSLIFAICMKISHKYRGIISGSVLLILTVIGKTLTFEGAFCKFYLNINCLSLLSFSIGIGCYYLLRFLQIKHIKNKTIMLFSGIFGVIAFILWFPISAFNLSSNVLLSLKYLIYLSIITFASAYSSNCGRVSRLSVKLGDASFSFYLIHYYIVSLSERALHIDSFGFINVCLMVIVIVVCWLVSYVSYFIVEKKICGFLAKKYNKFLEVVNTKRNQSAIG